jgi:NTP pyrophosphatase (non-canonical NTP hydrolase)
MKAKSAKTPKSAKKAARSKSNSSAPSDIRELTEAILKFRDERDWSQFHDAKNVAICLSVEAGELLEAFLWKAPEEVARDKIADELADVFYSAFLLAHTAGLDVRDIVLAKLAKNAAKYPVAKARGSRKKYTEL